MQFIFVNDLISVSTTELCLWVDVYMKKQSWLFQKKRSYITLHFINLTTKMLSVISVSRKLSFTTQWFDGSWLDNGFSSVCCYWHWPYSSWLLRCLNTHKQKLPIKLVTGFSGFMDTDHCTSGWVVLAVYNVISLVNTIHLSLSLTDSVWS
jgi:hypothetical protein